MNTPQRIKRNGYVEWKLPDGTRHREDGPAVIYGNGDQSWYWYGKLHRTDGPAIIKSNGAKEYWLGHLRYDPVTYLIKRYEYKLDKLT